MSMQITHVRFEDSNNKTHETISAYQYLEGGSALWRWKQNMVQYVEAGNRAFVGTGTSQVEAIVVDHNPKYLRTVADGQWANNLLNLPLF